MWYEDADVVEMNELTMSCFPWQVDKGVVARGKKFLVKSVERPPPKFDRNGKKLEPRYVILIMQEVE